MQFLNFPYLTVQQEYICLFYVDLPRNKNIKITQLHHYFPQKIKTILLLSYCSTKCGKLEMRKCVCTVTACGSVVLGGGKCMFHLPSCAFAAKLNIVCVLCRTPTHPHTPIQSVEKTRVDVVLYLLRLSNKTILPSGCLCVCVGRP